MPNRSGSVRGLVSTARCYALPFSLSIVVAAISLACASPPSISDKAPPRGEIQSVLIVSMNFEVAPTSARMVRGIQMVETAVARYLGSLDLRVKRTKFSETLELWRSALEATGAADTDLKKLTDSQIASARAELASRLADRYPNDLVAMPTVLIREGQVSGFTLRWDGVVRDFPADDGLGRLVGASMRGKSAGTSLRMLLFTPRGEQFFESYTGLEPIHRIKVMSAQTYRTELRSDLFQDPAIIADSVQMAFRPYLQPGDASD